jgi:SAM-dependent methyltransferase
VNSTDQQQDARVAIVQAGYDALVDDYLEWSSRSVDPSRNSVLAEFADLLAPNADVLDLGCGAGVPSTAWLAERFTVTGVDVSSGQLEAARRNVPDATFIRGDFSSVAFDKASFDGVVALYSITHVPRERHAALFERIAEWLRPGGVFLATLGADGGDDWTGEWLGQRMFFSSFDAERNKALLIAAGLDLIKAEVVDTFEPEGRVSFLWVLASRPA